VSNRSVLVALKVMEELAAHQPIGVSDLARLLGISKSTAHRALLTLAEAGWIETSGDRRSLWRLSVRALIVGGRAIDSQGGLRGIAVPVMEDLRRSTEETIHLLVRERTHVVLIERLDGIKAVRVFNPVGGRASIFRTSSGKAILASLPPGELAAYLEILRSRADLGAMDPAELLTELETVRAQGFAVNLGSNQPDVHAVAAAILDDGRPVAAVTVSAPPERLTEAVCERIGPLVVDAARRVSVGLRASR
jgi:IclR family transcriptional regulator, acetate operon repressor